MAYNRNMEWRFEIRFRNRKGQLCRFTYPCDLYTPEECEGFVKDIEREGATILSAGVI